ncbi:GIY-YIG nuclease family protein [Magnetospirillum sp. 15-1]|uniref:GIY-YIG nuclease family protein n=1 Tax=Magnetospirillum sp. 15-1 TaxID=1979370 RepID=UPI000BBBC516|nr:GIY-YIG nuclease family protein [Magnetospirillum sp. 15-1]
MVEQSDLELLAELGVEIEPERKGSRTAREERIIAGFEDIQRFYEQHGRAPRHGEGNDIFERMYAVRLDRLREQEECRALLLPMDRQELLSSDGAADAGAAKAMDDDALLAALGVEAGGEDDLSNLRHVRSVAEKRAAEEIANRTKCDDFDRFKALFVQVQKELDAGIRQTRPFVKDAGFLKADIQAGQFFVLGGQTAYVAEIGKPIKAPNGETDARLRVIYSNGTESDLLLRSLQRALYKDDAGRRISEPSAGPLFDNVQAEGDTESGTIYVLRSKSDHPVVASHREVLHKIGVTGGSVEQRVANAKLDPTYLLAEVEVVATYKLCNINRSRLEHLIHRFFEPARLKIEITDRFGHPVSPKEWFLVPRFAIDEAVDRIRDGTIANFTYDPSRAKLVAHEGG